MIRRVVALDKGQQIFIPEAVGSVWLGLLGVGVIVDAKTVQTCANAGKIVASIVAERIQSMCACSALRVAAAECIDSAGD